MPRRLRAQEPVAPYVADDDRRQARLFANGRSQAIRLPKEFRMPGEAVWIHREGKRLIVEPVEAVERDALGHPVGFWEEQRRRAQSISEAEWAAYRSALPDDPAPPPVELDDDGTPIVP